MNVRGHSQKLKAIAVGLRGEGTSFAPNSFPNAIRFNTNRCDKISVESPLRFGYSSRLA